MEGRREHVDDGGAVADPAITSVRDAPPEQGGGAEKARCSTTWIASCSSA